MVFNPGSPRFCETTFMRSVGGAVLPWASRGPELRHGFAQGQILVVCTVPSPHSRPLASARRSAGIIEKQSSMWFQAKSCQNTIQDNIAFNQPRAAINFNDGFGGGRFCWARSTHVRGAER